MKTQGLLVAMAAALAVGCSSQPAEMRSYTYPPEFRYIEKNELKGAMGRLAHDATALQAVLERPMPLSNEDRDSVVRLLDDMRETTKTLESPGQLTNHPMLDRHLGDFSTTIVRAKQAAEANPPNYFLAGNVTGACLSCHGPATR